MALLAGVLVTGFSAQLSGATSSNISAGSVNWTPVIGLPSQVLIGGKNGTGVVTAEAKVALTANTLPWFHAQLYNRVHVMPNVLNLGNLLSDQIRSVEVWNAHTDSRYLASITETAINGVTYTSSATPPYTFGSNESRIFTFNVSTTGEPTLNGRFTFNFPAETPSLSVTANRIVVFSFAPNWSEPPQEGLSWKTDIITSYNGKEQRRMLRMKPRRSLAYTYLLDTPQKRARWASIMFGWQHRTFAVPVWQDQQWLHTDLPLGSTQIAVSTSYNDFEADTPALLYKSATEWEVVEVSSCGGGTVYFKQPTLRDWAVPYRLVPMRVGKAPAQQETTKHTDVMSSIRIAWELASNSGICQNRLATTGFPYHQGFEVLVAHTDWSIEQSESSSRKTEVVDSEAGLITYDEHTAVPVYTRPFVWTIKGRENIAKMLAWLSDKRGRLMPFYMPSQSCDVEQALGIGATEVRLTIKDIQYSAYYALNQNRCDLAFYPAQGMQEPIFRRIVDCAQGPNGTEILTLDSSFGSEKLVGAWRRISFTTLCRLDTDSVIIDWVTDDVVRVRFAVVEVIQ